MNDQDGKTPEYPELEYVADFKVLEEMQVSAGPPEPDIGMVGYDPDTEEGQAHLRAYQDRYRQACQDADAKWEQRYPGRTFRRRWTPEREAHWAARTEWQRRAVQIMTEGERQSGDGDG